MRVFTAMRVLLGAGSRRNEVNATIAPRVTTTYAAQAEPTAAQCAVFSQCFFTITGTTGVETTASRKQGANKIAVATD